MILHQPTKFHSNWTIHGRILTLYRLPRWRPQPPRFLTSGFGFVDVNPLKRSKSICNSNFSEIYQSTVETLLLTVWKTDGRHIGTFCMISILVLLWSAVCDLHRPIKFHTSRTTQNGRHISFQNGGHGVAILFPVSNLTTSHIQKIQSYVHTKF